MHLAAIYRRNGDYPVYRAVFDEQTERGAAMLRFSEDFKIGRWVSAPYDSGGQNEHLGERTTLAALGDRALDSFFHRLSIPDDWEGVSQTIEHIIKEDKEEET